VGAKEGFWRESTLSDVFLKCREGVCVEEVVVGPLSIPSKTSAANFSTSRRLFGATEPSNATSPGNCVEGNTGPLCGLCVPGYVLQSGQCLPCDPNDAFDNWSAGSKAALLVLCVFAGLILVAFALFQPLVPALERASVSFMACLSAACRRCFDCCSCCFSQRSKAEGASEPGKVTDVQLIEKDVPNRFDALTEASGIDDGGGVAHVHAPQQRTELQEARQEAAAHGISSAIASGVGNAMAVGLELNGEEIKADAAEVILQGFDGLEELMEQAQRVAKILVNFYQASLLRGYSVTAVSHSHPQDRLHVYQVAGHTLALRLHSHHEQGEHRKPESSSAAGRRLSQSQSVLLQTVQRCDLIVSLFLRLTLLRRLHARSGWRNALHGRHVPVRQACARAAHAARLVCGGCRPTTRQVPVHHSRPRPAHPLPRLSSTPCRANLCSL